MEFIRYCKNHFKYKLFKFLLYLLIGVGILLFSSFISIQTVKADTIKRYYIQDTDGTKSTWWNAYPTSGYDYTYTNQYIVVDYIDSPEKYVVLSTCLTGDLDMQITSNLRGNIEYLEYQTGASCQVKDQTWVGRMFYYIFKVNEYYDPNAQNELYVSFDLKVANYNTYLVYQDIFRVETYSNYPNLGTNDKEFEDIKDGLDNIDSSINETNDKLDEAEETRKGIWETIKDLPNMFLEMLKGLIIPDDEFFSNWFEDLQTFFEEKLGFLATPITLFIDFVNYYLELDSSNDIIINIPDITVPNFEDHKIISATTLNWTELLRSKEAFNNLWMLYLDFIDVFLILNFIGLCERVYARIFGGDTSNYEYYTVEDSTSFDKSGEVLGTRRNERTTTRKKVS